MTFLDVFALVVLGVLLVTALGAWVLLGMLPGKIAEDRGHPQVDAIRVCGWCGALTLGILSPLAFIWAHTKHATTNITRLNSTADQDDTNDA